jgi:hypothetical protein
MPVSVGYCRDTQRTLPKAERLAKMSYLIAAPELMAEAASDLAGINSELSEARSSASHATVALAPAAADEVSIGIAHLFAEHAHGFQALAGKASAFHEQFAQNLRTSAAAYSSIDHANATLLHRATYHLQLLQQAAHDFADGADLRDTERHLGIPEIHLGQNPNVGPALIFPAFLVLIIVAPVALVLVGLPLLVIIQLMKWLGLGWLL